MAIITGAGCVGPGWGNGRSMVYRFMEEGASILAVDKSQDTLTETLEVCAPFGEKIQKHICDATNGEAVSDMMDVCVENFGRLDILVNNVGGSKRGGPVELTEEDWDLQIDHNLKTVFLGCKFAIPHMEKTGGGAIVNIASTWIDGPARRKSRMPPLKQGYSNVTGYSSGVCLTKIRVNSILPGQLHTPMVEARLADQRTGGDVDKLLEQRQSRIPLGFMGDGRDTANAAVFLASDEARFVTGTELVVDGGMTARCD